MLTLIMQVIKWWYWLLLWCLWWHWVSFHLLCKWPCGGTGYHCSACGGTWYAFTDSGVQMVVLVIVMGLVVVLGMLPLIMEVAIWWYWLLLWCLWWHWVSFH